MKEKYEKPLLVMEHFAFAQTVARDCSDMFKDMVTSNDINNCGWDLGGGDILFLLGNVCTQDGSTSDYGCYNNPTPENQIFRS